MTKNDQLSKLTTDAAKLDEDALNSLVEMVEHLASGQSYYALAPQSVRDSIDRGIEDAKAGRIVSSEHALSALRSRIRS